MPDNSTDTAAHPSFGSLALSRRRALVGAAWTAPVIVVASAVPAFAFSGATAVIIGSVSGARSAFVAPPYYFWSGGTSGYTLKNTAPGTIQSPAVMTVTVAGISTSGGAGTGTVTLVVTVPSNVAVSDSSNRAAGQYGSTGSGWSLSGTPAINTTTRVTTWTFVSASAAVGDSLPDLTFSCTNSSNSGATVYAWIAGGAISVSGTASGSSAPATVDAGVVA